jgi:hypothetical protein
MSIGTYTPDTVTVGNVPSEVPNENGDPGSVNAPAVAEPSSAFTGGKPVLLIAASGASAAYGGCEVHVSFDGTNYSLIGTIESSAPQGVLTSNLADHADPDTVNTIAVDCTESFAALPAGVTNADADNDRTLSLVCAQPSASVLDNAGELLAFGAVAATGTYTANLTYLRRGQLGSAHAAHSSGDMFTVLDVLGESGTALRYDLPPQYINTTIYLKLAAFNQFGNATQDLSLCTEYQFTPIGRGYGGGTNGVPTMPIGLTASAGVQSVSLSWSANPVTDNVTAYQVYRAAGTGASFGSASLIATVGGLAYLDTGLGVATGYTYFLEAVNAIGASSPTSGVNATTSATALGTVTSVALTVPAEFSVAGSPITGAGTLAVSKATQNANLVYAGPVTGSAAVPVFRSLVAADLPLFTSSLAGAVPASGGGTTNFARADGTWAIPPGSSGGGGSGAWWSMIFNATSTFTHSLAASGNLIDFQYAASIGEVFCYLTTVTSATYKIGLAPYNRATNKMTAAPTYGTLYTEGAGAAHKGVRASFPGGFAVAAGTTIIMFIVRTDSTTTVSTTLDTAGGNALTAVYMPGIFSGATSTGSCHLASVSPGTGDTWTTEGGFYVVDFSYQLS